MAQYWQSLQNDLRLARHAALYGWAAERLSPGVVLDLGCEYGFGAALLREANPALQVVSIDNESECVSVARRLLPGKSMSVVRADARALPIADDTLQGACLMNLLHLLPDPLAVLREVARVVVPQQPVLLSLPLGPDLLQPWREVPVKRHLIHLCRQAFHRVEILTVIEGPVPGSDRMQFAVGPGTAFLVVEIR